MQLDEHTFEILNEHNKKVAKALIINRFGEEVFSGEHNNKAYWNSKLAYAIQNNDTEDALRALENNADFNTVYVKLDRGEYRAIEAAGLMQMQQVINKMLDMGAYY